MTGGVNPVVRGRRLAAALRDLRTSSGRTVEEVAVHLECSSAKISRIENGLVGVRIQDARELLELYGVHGAQREELLELVRQARSRGWWFPYTDVMPAGFDRILGFEDEAATMAMLETRLVPGLLQTERYAAELFTSVRDVPQEVIDRRLKLRMERQQVLARPDPPALRVVLDEAVLRRRIGPPSVMAEQYRRLILGAQAPAVTLRVLPLDAGVHQAAGFSFTVFTFSDPADPRLVYEELFNGSLVYETAEAAGRYTAAFDQAEAGAWSEADSLQFLAGLAEGHG